MSKCTKTTTTTTNFSIFMATQCNVRIWVVIIIFWYFRFCINGKSMLIRFFFRYFECTGHTFPIIYLLTLKPRKSIWASVFAYGNSIWLWNRKRNFWLFVLINWIECSMKFLFAKFKQFFRFMFRIVKMLEN